MFDRTSYTVTFDGRDLSPETIQAIAARLMPEVVDQDGTTYQLTEIQIRVGEAETIANDIKEVLPHHSFSVFEHPAYEWLGTLVRHDPELGMHTTPCDKDATPVTPCDDICAAIAQSSDLADLAERLHKLMGTDWRLPDQETGDLLFADGTTDQRDNDDNKKNDPWAGTQFDQFPS